MARIKREELLEKLFRDDYEHLKGKRLRLTRVRVPGKEVCLAHVLSPSEACIYENLGLHIGVHEGEDHRGEAVGMIHNGVFGIFHRRQHRVQRRVALVGVVRQHIVQRVAVLADGHDLELHVQFENRSSGD